MTKSRLTIAGVLIVLIAAAALAVQHYHPMIAIGAGYKAKLLCSGIFVSKREPARLLAEDLYVDGFETLGLFRADIDRAHHAVTASLLGFWQRTAVYREGLGCTLAINKPAQALQSEKAPAVVSAKFPVSLSELWPQGSRTDVSAFDSDVDEIKLREGMEVAFSEPNREALQRTRAVVVVHRGRIVAERYANGYDKNTALLGWSMSKSALNALIGIAITNPAVAKQLRRPIDLTNARLLPNWRDSNRSDITLKNLLQMSSGLAFAEEYDDYEGDVLQMLFAVDDMGAYAAEKHAVAAADTRWSYSSGTTNILSYILRRQFKNPADYLALPKRHLFKPLGMRSAVLEPDAAGTFTASSFMYATARDWARLGLLYLRDGDWFGRQILPAGWLARSLTPAVAAQQQHYAMHVWLKLPDRPRNGEPPMPEDSYYMLGHDGQVVAILPSRQLVIVRLGLARKPGSWQPELILGPITAAFPVEP